MPRRSTASAPTWSPTAATSSCSGSRTAWRGSASRAAARLPGLGGRRSSSRSSRRSTRRRPTSRGSRSRASRRDAGSADRRRARSSCRWSRPAPGRRRGASRLVRRSTALDGLAEGELTAIGVGGIGADGGQRRGHAARLPRRLRGLRRPARRRRAERRASLRCPSCERRYFLPARRALARRGPLQLEPVPAARRRGPASGWRWPRERVARARRRRRGARPRWCRACDSRIARRRGGRPPARRRTAPAGERCDLCGNGSPTTIATCSHLDRAADPLRLRGCWRCAPATPTTGPTARGPCGSTTSSSPTSCGRASRSRSAWRSSCATARPAAWSPSTRARPGRPSPSCDLEAWDGARRAQPGARRRSRPTSRR